MPRSGRDAQARIELPITREGLAAALAAQRSRGSRRLPIGRPTSRSIGLPAAAGAQLGAMLRPIATPLVIGGFEPEIGRLLCGRVPRCRLRAGGRRRSPAARPRRRRTPRARCARATPSASSLIGGDLEMGATGTVTEVDGDRVYAFGHPFYNLGPAAVPDDAGLRLHDPAEPPVVDQDLVDGRDDRHDPAGSRDGHRRHARQGPGARCR